MSLICKQHKFTHIQIPKTGTSSVKHYFDKLNITTHEIKHKLPVWSHSDWKKHFTFAFVRRPEDWLYSWYSYRRNNPKHMICKKLTFAQWLLHINDNPRHSLDWEYRHQHEWLLDENGKILVDYVEKYDNIDQGLKYVCDKLNLPHHELGRVNVGTYDTEKKQSEVSSSRDIINRYYAIDYDIYNSINN